MRPDAVVKYPDERNVIIDSKVSIFTAFTELVDETDAEVYAMKLNQHLSSIKNHINQLSQSVRRLRKIFDFVMMFIPSEPAYIAAMQADQKPWNFAYERRIYY